MNHLPLQSLVSQSEITEVCTEQNAWPTVTIQQVGVTTFVCVQSCQDDSVLKTLNSGFGLPGLKSWSFLLLGGNFQKFHVTFLSLNFFVCEIEIRKTIPCWVV